MGLHTLMFDRYHICVTCHDLCIALCRDGSIALCSLQDGGLLGQWQEHVQPDQQVAAVAFAPGNKGLLALACAESFTVLTSPWQQKPCAVLNCYDCPQVRACVCAHMRVCVCVCVCVCVRAYVCGLLYV